MKPVAPVIKIIKQIIAEVKMALFGMKLKALSKG
jgi:hypothetical protein